MPVESGNAVEQTPGEAALNQAAAALAARAYVPRATYRIQFNHTFTFADARRLAGYFAELGVSDVYASPIFKAVPGSMHGYDVLDHRRINPELGDEEALNALHEALAAQGLGLVLDIVPNHMGINDPNNPWWMDVLENGPSSLYADMFDIDWRPVKREMENKVLLPILEDQYGNVLEQGKLILKREEGSFYTAYYEMRLPLAPRSYELILSHRLEELQRALGEEDEHVQELQSILTALSYLPPREALTPEKLVERVREKEVIKRRLATLLAASPAVREAIDATMAEFNGRPGEPATFDALDRLLADQSWRAAFWRVATEEINYRRFFDINNLAAIRTERPEVFRAVHELPLRLIREGKVRGLRVDHPDGLRNPGRYFRALQEAYLAQALEAQFPAATQPAPGAESGTTTNPADGSPPPAPATPTLTPPRAAARRWLDQAIARRLAAAPDAPPGEPWPLYVVAEKILAEDEVLPPDWPVAGTTGYDFLNLAGGLFINPQHRPIFDRIYSQFTGMSLRFNDLIYENKQKIMRASLASEINALAHGLARIAEGNRRTRDFTLISLTTAIREFIAALPVYRTYINADREEAGSGAAPIDARDIRTVEQATQEAARRNPRIARATYDFLRDTLLLRNLGDFSPEARSTILQFVMKFQQVTGPIMAKGLEDTTFYIYNRLAALNEVGGHPLAFGVSPQRFHAQCQAQRRRWPDTMLAGSTHDTKRSEDVRARLAVLSELPGPWRAALNRWGRLNARKKTMVDGEPAPDRNDEYLLYQTLIGAWPIGLTGGDAAALADFRERVTQYMLKAIHEAKVHTSWVNPNEAYDEAVRRFVARLLPERPGDRFLQELVRFQRRLAALGQFNALAQTLLRLTAPGVPDFYQGTELWDLSLVDPDNRRPVDYERRHQWLRELRARIDECGADLGPLAEELLRQSDDGRIKLYVIHRALGLRRQFPELWGRGEYLPLEAHGARRDHVLAFARRGGGREVLTVVPLLIAGLLDQHAAQPSGDGGAGAEPGSGERPPGERPPVGAAVWRDTWLALPGLPEQEATANGEPHATRYRNLLTGEALLVRTMPAGPPGLNLADLLARFPVALLLREEE